MMCSSSFSGRPAVVVWEMTRACRLACRHCRAESGCSRHPGELDTREAERLLAELAEADPSLLILTGGDPSRRPDLLPLVAHASGLGLRVALSPSATPDLLAMDFGALKAAGVWRMSLSLDGASPETHNRFRGVARAWSWTMDAAAVARRAGIPLQINSTVTARTIEEFDRLAAVVSSLDPAGWTLFLLVPTGRAAVEDLPPAEGVEALFERLLAFSRTVRFPIRTTEGPHYRRFLRQHGEATPPAVNDGDGFLFISHLGEICPSGFLPMVAGNVRVDRAVDVYRESRLFRGLRDRSRLGGRCGRCDFRGICGGSRARAYAVSGDPFAEDPLCCYEP